MNVLIADADAGIRQVLKRALSKTYGCDVVEAATGLEVLDMISQGRTDIVVLDMRLPVMDGIEVLEAMRASEQFRQTPMVVLSSDRDAEIISRLIHLGVSDVVLKPLRTDRFVARFGTLVSKVTAARLKMKPTHGPPPELAPGAFVMLADGDPEYRALFEKTLDGQFSIATVSTAAEAIGRCLSMQPPKAVFIGKDLGLVTPELLARKLRSTLGARVRLVAVASKREVDAIREEGWSDSVIPRSFVAATLRNDIKKLLQQASSLNQFNVEFPGLRVALLSASEQVSGLMMNSEVEGTDGQLKIDRDRIASAVVTLNVGSFTLHMKLRYGLNSGRYVAGAFLGLSPDDVAAEDVEAVAGELANVIAGRIHNQYVKTGATSTMSLPTIGSADASAADDPFDASSTVCLAFNEVYSPLAFEVRVRVEHTPVETAPGSIDANSELFAVRTDS